MVVEAARGKACQRVAAKHDALKAADVFAFKYGNFTKTQFVAHALREWSCLIHHQPANVNGKLDISKLS
ncbi:hypothetical protein BN136_3236 [Cronobacter universalis NCTC 9529]|nr:hypothetical protein BN136_3236 [Cronobacter universalis NCTC 9529]